MRSWRRCAHEHLVRGCARAWAMFDLAQHGFVNVEATVGWGQWGDATYLNIRRLAAADPIGADACDGACARVRLTPTDGIQPPSPPTAS